MVCKQTIWCLVYDMLSVWWVWCLNEVKKMFTSHEFQFESNFSFSILMHFNHDWMHEKVHLCGLLFSTADQNVWLLQVFQHFLTEVFWHGISHRVGKPRKILNFNDIKNTKSSWILRRDFIHLCRSKLFQ